MEQRHPNHPGEMSLDASVAERNRSPAELQARARAIRVLTEAGIPFLVGGTYAYAQYTGIYRDTKDLDLFPRRRDALAALDVLAADGWHTERKDEVWLYKGYLGESFVDLIFSSGNGVADVDDEWFTSARPGRVFGQEVWLVPPEEMIWSKAFVLERERYDGGDINHLLRAWGRELDWERLLRRFDRYWEVLLSHLMLFRFAYPCERDVVPDAVMAELLGRTAESMREGRWGARMCRGNLISRVNYVVDIREWGYRDGRKWDEAEREATDAGDTDTGCELQDSGGGGW